MIILFNPSVFNKLKSNNAKYEWKYRFSYSNANPSATNVTEGIGSCIYGSETSSSSMNRFRICSHRLTSARNEPISDLASSSSFGLVE